MGEMEAIFSHQNVTSITDVKEAISTNLGAELVNLKISNRSASHYRNRKLSMLCYVQKILVMFILHHVTFVTLTFRSFFPLGMSFFPLWAGQWFWMSVAERISNNMETASIFSVAKFSSVGLCCVEDCGKVRQ
jgi:hypothetical protein